MLKIINCLDAVSEYTGRAVAWLVLLLPMLIGYDVVMRYVLQRGSIAAQELEWHIFAVLILLGAAYTLKHDSHVRVDILYQKLNARHRAWINLGGYVFFLLPFCVLITESVWPFVYNAYIHSERSADPGGLPHRFLLKAMIPLGFVLLALQGAAEMLKQIVILRGPKS